MTHSDFFYISSGEGNCMYTLRHCYKENRGTYIASRNHYWVNLSTDWDTAVSKAQEHVDAYNAETKSDVSLLMNDQFDLNEWGTAGSHRWFEDSRNEAQKAFDADYREGWVENIRRDREAREEVRKAQRIASRHYGTVGDRQEFDLNIQFIKDFDHRVYGVSHMYIMHDADGNCFKYFGKVFLGNAGDDITLLATIKEHEVFTHNQWNDKEEYDQEQTKLARPKVLSTVTLEEVA